MTSRTGKIEHPLPSISSTNSRAVRHRGQAVPLRFSSGALGGKIRHQGSAVSLAGSSGKAKRPLPSIGCVSTTCSPTTSSAPGRERADEHDPGLANGRYAGARRLHRERSRATLRRRRRATPVRGQGGVGHRRRPRPNRGRVQFVPRNTARRPAPGRLPRLSGRRHSSSARALYERLRLEPSQLRLRGQPGL